MMLSTTVTVRQILEQKGTAAHAVAPTVSVLDALTLMAKQDIGPVLVTENERLVGIFTERDYARKLALKGLTSRDATVGDLMTPTVCTLTPAPTTDAATHIMTASIVCAGLIVPTFGVRRSPSVPPREVGPLSASLRA